MHIPDGYISPQTAAGLWALMVPAWYAAGQVVKRALDARLAPLLAIGAAFSFVVMMFNIPVPGGTTGHAVGGTLIAIAIGPWAAVVSLTVALVIQALFFGDGGILAIGANSFNIAFALPLAGYYTYRLIAAQSPLSSRRRWLAAGIGGFVGINLSAFLTAVEIGIQPELFQTANGVAMYSPYGLSQALPAMMLAHVTVIGFVEAAVTSLTFIYLVRTNPALLGAGAGSPEKVPGAGFRLKPLLVGLALFIVFVPLGLLASGTAWGEWSPDEVREQLGYVPEGLSGLAGFWGRVVPDYGAADGFWSSTPGYVVSAVTGMALVALVSFAIARLLNRRTGGGRG
ncbi:MAG: cobalt transporter CbiM [Thermoleophilia bacterium]